MPNNTWISILENYLGLYNGFYPNNLIFIRHVEANKAYFVASELPSSSIKYTYIVALSNIESKLIRIFNY
jgi:hypothetical protein